MINLLSLEMLNLHQENAEATFGNAIAKQAYDAYSGYIAKAKDLFYGTGLLLEINGHFNQNLRTEFGYLLSADDLDQNNTDARNSSIKALASRMEMSFAELLQGSDSLGGFLEADRYYNEHYFAVPSPTSPGPGIGNPYFPGGLTIQTEGSRDAGNVDAVQVDYPFLYRNISQRIIYAKTLARTIVKFMNKYYSLEERIIQVINMMETERKRLLAKKKRENDERYNQPESFNKTGAITFSMIAIGILVLFIIAYQIFNYKSGKKEDIA